MMMHRCNPLVAMLLVLIAVPRAYAQSIEIDDWLVIDPMIVASPGFAGDSESFGEELLDLGPQDVSAWAPEAGISFIGHDGHRHQWQRRTGDLTFEPPAEAPSIAWAATYIDVNRRQSARLVVQTHGRVRAFVDGDVAATKSTAESSTDEPGTLRQQIELTPGKHTVLLKLAFSGDGTETALTAKLEPIDPSDSEAITVSTEAARFVRMHDLTDAPTPTSVSISPDGGLVATTITHRAGGNEASRIEIRRTDDASLVQTLAGGTHPGGIQWLPTGQRFSYTHRSGGKSDLWLVDLQAGTQEILLRGIERLGAHHWSPDASFIIYAVTEETETDDSGVRRMEYLESRRPGFANRSHLYRLDLASRSIQRLTAGPLSTRLNDISPDGARMLITRSHIDYSRRPFTINEFSIVDLTTLAVDSLFAVPFAGSGQFTSDGSRILLTGGPTAFGAIGSAVPEGTVPNDYDTQVYLYDIDSGDVASITRDFDPSISNIIPRGDHIYITATDASYERLYGYDLTTEAFHRIDAEGDVVRGLSVAERQPIGAYVSSGTSSPPKAWLIDLTNGTSRLLADPSDEAYANIRFGDVRDWTFINQRGAEIDGHVYYPPDFDPNRTYPTIVYYYGGTTPVTRDFAGRYPKELWAANGYLVYVLQPSGAIGYGQDFSALHVNDWGEIVADEIIDGVRQYLAAHPYADADRVGAIGASFGGFMTMLLQTRTDLFAAAVSHAGISNIASYWGEGFWGFQYSAIATADSYPWNRPDVYVDRSPLFAADRITTPLLLLHGGDDTNVPVGESLQMFTALKLLGREVEYVEVDGQDHHILDHDKNVIWTNTILAWFDRWLKDQPEWWGDLF